MHILIVEDDDATRRALQRILESAGHTTCWASSGQTAMHAMQFENVDAVSLDIDLGPGQMSGWDVLREKMLNPKLRKIPVVILTGMPVEDVRAGAQTIEDALVGTKLILGKPPDAGALIRAFEHVQKDG